MSGEEDIKYWPKNRVIPENELLSCRCSSCGQAWGVQEKLAGYRFLCDCGAWIQVPWPTPDGNAPKALPVPDPYDEDENTQLSLHRATKDEAGLVSLPPRPLGEPIKETISTSVPLAPGQLRHANVTTRQRWTSRAILELFLIMLAFWVPQIVIMLSSPPDDWTRDMWIASIFSSVIVVLIALVTSSYGFSGLRWPKAKYFAQAFLGLIVAILFAWGYVELFAEAFSGAEEDEKEQY